MLGLPLLRRYVGEHDAEDVLQAVFFKLSQRHEAPDDLAAWLDSVARRQAIDLSRVRNRAAARLRALAEAGRARVADDGRDAAPWECRARLQRSRQKAS